MINGHTGTTWIETYYSFTTFIFSWSGTLSLQALTLTLFVLLQHGVNLLIIAWKVRASTSPAVFRTQWSQKLLAHNRKPIAVLSGVASFTWQHTAVITSGEVSPISCCKRETLAVFLPRELHQRCSWSALVCCSRNKLILIVPVQVF